MRDFLPADVRKREYVIGVIKQVYESYGFEPLETPAVENIETLMGKYGDEGNQLIFKILKRGEKLDESLETGDGKRELADLALRYDLTVPLARVVANNRNDLPKFFKRYQIQPVWRADRPARGRFREFYQCDVDCIASESMVVEAEIIAAAGSILNILGFTDFVIRINHRRLLTAILDTCGIETEFHPAALVTLDKIDKIGSEGVTRELAERGISETSSERLLELFFSEYLDELFLADDNLEKLKRLRNFIGQNEDSIIALGDLEQILKFQISNFKLRIDPSLARGLSYYTGTIMEINVPDLAGSLGGGGRYDGLIGMFGKEQIPACGFSLGLERILVVMEERGMFPPEIAEATPADVLVTISSEETVADSLKLANQLRAAGLRVTLYPQADKEDKQWKYANSIGAPWICTVRSEDIAEGKVSFQNLKTRERYREPLDQVAAKIKIA